MNILSYLQDNVPRPEDEELFRKARDIAIPPWTRYIIIAVPVFLFVTIALLNIMVCSKGRFTDDLKLMLGQTKSTTGMVKNVSLRKGSKGSTTYTYEFSYSVPEKSDKIMNSICFSGSVKAELGKECPVVYLAGDPSIACIKDCRLTRVSVVSIIIMSLVTLILCSIFFIILFNKIRQIKTLLRCGLVTEGKVISIKRGSKGAVFVKVEYDYDGNTFHALALQAPSRKAIALIKDIHENRKPIQVLFLPDKPKRVFILDYFSLVD